MPKKVPFQVVYSSGWEEEFPVTNLEVHSPFVKGWRSPRFCLYPQEIVVQIQPPGQFRKLQLLSHQHMIAQRVELHVGHYTGDSRALEKAKFTRLGYVSFSDNQSNHYKSMELKSVDMDCAGELVKLVLHRNHINPRNIYNQVGLVAINIIASPISTLKDTPPGGLPSGVFDLIQKSNTNAKLASLLHTYLPGINPASLGTSDPVLKGKIKPPKISPADDLSFAITQDPEIADLVKKLEKKKKAAIDEENFNEAKRLKMVVDELCKAGKMLCRYEVEKKEAVFKEDFDAARTAKEKLDDARAKIYQQLDLHGILSGGGKRRSLRRSQSPHQSLPPVSGASQPTERSSNSQRPVPIEDRSNSPLLPPIVLESPPRERPPIRPPRADDRPLPALIRKSPEEEVDGGEGEDFKAEPLSEKQLNEVSFAAETFGMQVCEELCAKQFSLRERALTSIREHLESQSKGLNRKEILSLLRATCQALNKGLKDKVFSTFSRSQDILQYILGAFAQKHSLTNQDWTFIVEKVTPTLLIRTGDLSPRIHEVSQDLITELFRHEKIKYLTLLGPMLVEPFKAKTPSWRLIKSRVVLLERLMEDPGFTPASGLTGKKVMKFIVEFLEHSNGEVRDTVIRLITKLYRVNGPEVRSLMPVTDTTASRKKKLWKTVFEGFDRVDGVPSPAEREAKNKAAENARDEEILELQKQVEMMKKMVASTDEAVPDQAQAVPGETDTIDKMCVFCGKHQEGLQSEAAMEQHYLEECPMLHLCPHCQQVIEISGLTKHWLTECEAKAEFRECPLCKEAILSNQFDGHVEAGGCGIAAEEGGERGSRCPLCHKSIPGGDEAWRTHLMGPEGHPSTCTHRMRASAGGKRGKKAASRKTGSTERPTE